MKKIRVSDALNEALREEMLRDENVFLMGEDIAENGGVFSVTTGLHDEFGSKRVKNTPISENGFTGLGIGAASLGLRPVVEVMYQDFILVCLDMIVNQAAKNRYMFGAQTSIPIVFRTQGGAGFGEGPQHSQSLEAIVAHIPGLKVIMPTNPYDAKGLLKSAIRDNNAVVFIEPATCYTVEGEVPEEDYLVPIGKADVKREGTDITIVALGSEVHFALEAAEILGKEGISVEVIDPRTLLPLDGDTIIKSVEKTGRLMTVHVACKTGGFGGEIVSQIAEKAFYSLEAPVRRLGAAFTPVPYNAKLETAHFPQVNDIVDNVRQMMED